MEIRHGIELSEEEKKKWAEAFLQIEESIKALYKKAVKKSK